MRFCYDEQCPCEQTNKIGKSAESENLETKQASEQRTMKMTGRHSLLHYIHRNINKLNTHAHAQGQINNIQASKHAKQTNSSTTAVSQTAISTPI